MNDVHIINLQTMVCWCIVDMLIHNYMIVVVWPHAQSTGQEPGNEASGFSDTCTCVL